MTKATIPVTSSFPPELEQQARVVAVNQGVSRAELVRRAVADYLKRVSDHARKATNDCHTGEIQPCDS